MARHWEGNRRGVDEIGEATAIGVAVVIIMMNSEGRALFGYDIMCEEDGVSYGGECGYMER